MMYFPPRLKQEASAYDMRNPAGTCKRCTPFSRERVSSSRRLFRPNAERMLSGVAPSWSRRRLLRARFLLAWRLEAGVRCIRGLRLSFPER